VKQIIQPKYLLYARGIREKPKERRRGPKRKLKN
jgi:hypothetical protein